MVKKFLLVLISAAVGAAAAVTIMLLARSNSFSNDIAEYTLGESNVVSSDALTDLAFNAAEAIKARDYKALADMIHPEYGVVFSPYATINLSTNVCLTADQIRHIPDNSEIYVWGLTSDGSEPIQMNITDYFSRYVFDYDYTVAPLIGVNHIVRSGNYVENIADSFPGAQYVDLCYPGDDSSESEDWSTLRLVFENYNGRLMLTAIIHSEYNI